MIESDSETPANSSILRHSSCHQDHRIMKIIEVSIPLLSHFVMSSKASLTSFEHWPQAITSTYNFCLAANEVFSWHFEISTTELCCVCKRSPLRSFASYSYTLANCGYRNSSSSNPRNFKISLSLAALDPGAIILSSRSSIWIRR